MTAMFGSLRRLFHNYILDNGAYSVMATHFDIQGVTADSKTFARSCHVRLGTGRVSFDVPQKAGSGSNTDAEFYEVYRKISPDTIKKSLESERASSKLDREIRNRCKGHFSMLMMDYDSKEMVPTSEMVEFLSDIQYPHTDIIVTPSWHSLISGSDSTNVGLYMRLTDEYLTAASRLNSKPIVVSIPQSLPPERIGDVLSHYIEKDVTSFCIDSHSRSLLKGSWMRKFHTSLDKAKEQYGIEKESLILSINSYQGIVMRNEGLIEAWDFLGFSAGTDIICGKHTSAYFRKDDQQDEARDEPTVARIFQPDTYCYRKVVCDKESKDKITDQSIGLQIAEMPTIRTSIEEGCLEELLGTKRISKGTLETILSLRGRGTNLTLDSFI